MLPRARKHGSPLSPRVVTWPQQHAISLFAHLAGAHDSHHAVAILQEKKTIARPAVGVVSVDGSETEKDSVPPVPVRLESPVPRASVDEGRGPTPIAPMWDHTRDGGDADEDAHMIMRSLCKGGAGPVDVLFIAWPEVLRATRDRVIWACQGWGVDTYGEPVRMSL